MKHLKKIEPLFWIFLITVATITVIAVKQAYGWQKGEDVTNNKEYNAKYYQEHKQQIVERKKKHYEEHKEEILARNRKWIEDNREQWNEYMRERRKKQVI